MFKLDARLETDTIALASWPLSELRLMNDANFPWLILVPRVEGVTELYQLDHKQRLLLDQESMFLGQTLMDVHSGDKLNVAALGNVVSQLHIHHIVRFKVDAVWPAPVWGKLPARAYTTEELALARKRLAPLVDQPW